MNCDYNEGQPPKLVALISFMGQTLIISDSPERIAGAEEALKAVNVQYTKMVEVK